MDAEKFRFRHWVLMCRVSIRCNERSLLALKSIGKLANIVAIWLETLQTISLIEIMKALEKLSRKSCRSYGDDYIGMIQIHVGRTSGDKKEQKWAIFSSMGRAKIWEAGKVTDIGASKQSQNPKMAGVWSSPFYSCNHSLSESLAGFKISKSVGKVRSII